MTRSKNAEAAAIMYAAEVKAKGYGPTEAWKPIASLLLTCGAWRAGQGWTPLIDGVVFKEANEFKPGSAVVRRGVALGDYLAGRLAVPRSDLCAHLGGYWRDSRFSDQQPNNLVGHAFRSMLVQALEMFGDPNITYREEVDPVAEFPGHPFPTRSKKPRIDIVARRGAVTVALISSRWRFRHDRVDLIDEALSYAAPATRTNPHCKQYAWTGECSPSRLEKVLDHTTQTNPKAAIAACVHFEPRLLSEGLKERELQGQLQSLEWLIQETFSWK